ncbi:MAG TPA: SPFH domain-containing protein [Candidatus Baltobacteraceae bacterium]|nr:SPFH domain-containing protein [Candidatus Baltobacteraceae bacterium]
MLPIRFMKAAPTTYVIQFRNGKVRREGPGLAFFYYAPTSTILTVPLASADAPFAFQEATADFQAITIQGQLTYRVSEPKRIAEVLDLSVAPNGVYRTDDYRKLVERLVHATQTSMREEMQKLTLREALMGSGVLSGAVLSRLRAADVVSRLGIEILNLSILSIRATPEMSKALEAEAREALQRRSDEAIYARRNNAVEQERRIKESELNTEIAVEEKQRQIRETRMAADIALEQQRAALMDQRVENEKKEADSRAYAMEATIKPVREVDWRTLMMLFPQNIDSRTTIALAFQEMATNAQKIGELNISPDLLNSLLAARPEVAKLAAPPKGK